MSAISFQPYELHLKHDGTMAYDLGEPTPEVTVPVLTTHKHFYELRRFVFICVAD